MKVAIVHYWLTGMRGGEKVLEAICDLFPEADIYTHVLDNSRISDKLKEHRIQTTFINKLPFAKKYYAYYLPLMPIALESLDLTQYDVIISSESGPAKGIIPSPDALHLCYTHSPMRYLWDMFYQYWGKAHWLKTLPISIMSHYLRQWDCSSSLRTDVFIANSSFVAKRIKKYYRRDAELIHPPVNIDYFRAINNPEKGYYLWVGELNVYKRPMDVIEVFTAFAQHKNKKIILITHGSDSKVIKAAKSDNIQLITQVDQKSLLYYYQNCRALLYPGIEDFGIIPVEAMACGRPVIAYNKGGIVDTVIHGTTGYLYNEQSAEGLAQAISEFEKMEFTFDSERIRHHSEQFSTKRFTQEFCSLLDKLTIPYQSN